MFRVKVRQGLLVMFGGVVLLAILLLVPGPLPAQAKTPSEALSPVGVTSSTVLDITTVITIGVAGPLEGGLAFYGVPVSNSVMLAISDTAHLGLNVGGVTYTLVLVALNDDCNPTRAISVANELVGLGVSAVVGHICSGASNAAQPIYAAAGVPMISPSSTSPGVTQQGYTTTFRTISADDAPPRLLARYFSTWLGLTRASIADSPNTGYSPFLVQTFSDAFSSLGGTVGATHLITSSADYTEALTAIQLEDPQIIYCSETNPEDTARFSKIAASLGMTDVVIAWTPMTESRSWFDTYTAIAGEAAQGDYAGMSYRNPDDMPGWDAFFADYQAAGFPEFGDDPTLIGAFAYDAARIILAAIQRAGTGDPVAVRDEIAATSQFRGVVGIYDGFDEFGDVIPQWCWIEHFYDDSWHMLQPTRVRLPMVRKN